MFNILFLILVEIEFDVLPYVLLFIYLHIYFIMLKEYLRKLFITTVLFFLFISVIKLIS